MQALGFGAKVTGTDFNEENVENALTALETQVARTSGYPSLP
jgi:hypothetical protein